MRLWPFKWELRQIGTGQSGAGSYITDVANYLAAGGAEANVNRTAAVEFALGMIGRAFMMAEVTPANPALTPLTKAMLARQTLAFGNAVFRIREDGRRRRPFVLEPVGEYSIRGNVREDSWRYQIKQYRPMGEDEDEDGVRANVPYEGMVHVRYMYESKAPWKGISPFTLAGMTSDQLAYIERSLSYDAQPPAGLMMPLPDGAGDTTVESGKSALTTGKGGLTLVETTAGGFGQGAANAPRADWEQKRYGPQVPAENVAMRDTTAEWLLDAAGIPAALHRSDGAAQRESYRHLFTATIEPIGALIAAELSEKLERDIDITFPQAFKSDMSARGRTLPSLIKAGVPAEAAGKLVGLPMDALPEEPESEPVSDEGLPDSEGDSNIPNSNTNGSTPNARIYTHL